MISLDTNIIVRLFIDTNPAQTAAAERCFAVHNELLIEDIALIEAIWVLTNYYGKDRGAAASCILSVLKNPKVSCNRALFTRALHTYKEHPALSIEDCCLAVYAELNEATPLLTFDRKLAAQTRFSELLSV
jgi:predicted nucleic-acid-binding protein